MVTVSGAYYIFRNVIFDANAKAGLTGMNVSGTLSEFVNDVWKNSVVKNLSHLGNGNIFSRIIVRDAGSGCTANMGNSGRFTMTNSYIIGALCAGLVQTATGGAKLNRVVFANNTGATSDGFQFTINPATTTEAFINSCIFYKNGRHGIFGNVASAFDATYMDNNVFYGNGNSSGTNAATAYGIDSPTTTYLDGRWNFNAFGNNKTADRLGINSGPNDVALTADPFVDGANYNFAPNATAGGGAALRAAGFPGTAATSTGYLDIGPFQHQDAASGAAAYAFVF
jgi:hypothetical protein